MEGGAVCAGSYMIRHSVPGDRPPRYCPPIILDVHVRIRPPLAVAVMRHDESVALVEGRHVRRAKDHGARAVEEQVRV